MRIWMPFVAWLLALGTLYADLYLPPPIWRLPEISSPEEKTNPVSIPRHWVSWNLHWFPGQSPDANDHVKKRHEQAIQLWIERLNPSVGVFQEVLSGEAMKRSAPQLPWQAVTRFARAEDEGTELPPQNLAICSRIPWRDAWEVDFDLLPMTSDRPVRGFLGVEWRNKKGERWTVYAVHLKSNRGGREASSKRRERAIEYLRMDWRKRGLNPNHDAILIAGDFNCSLKNPAFKKERTIRGLLAEGWESVTQELPWPKGATVRADEERGYPSADFDHILLSPGWKRRMGSNRIVSGVDQGADVPSDHWPVWMKW